MGNPSNAFDRPQGLTRLALARDRMTLVTSKLAPKAQRRQTLRELLDFSLLVLVCAKFASM
jgi:hypothetical protein